MLATAAIGASAWRRLGISRVAAIGGTWGGAAAAFASDSAAAWMAVFAFLSTGAIVYSAMRRDAFVSGLGAAAAWVASGITAARDAEAAWTCVFAFLTAGAVANGGTARGAVAIVAWAAAGAVMVALDGWYWLAAVAFLATAVAFGGRPSFPRRFEWDLFDRDDDPGVIPGQSRTL